MNANIQIPGMTTPGERIEYTGTSILALLHTQGSCRWRGAVTDLSHGQVPDTTKGWWPPCSGNCSPGKLGGC